MEWETPDYEEIGASAEVTAYMGRWDEPPGAERYNRPSSGSSGTPSSSESR